MQERTICGTKKLDVSSEQGKHDQGEVADRKAMSSQRRTTNKNGIGCQSQTAGSNAICCQDKVIEHLGSEVQYKISDDVKIDNLGKVNAQIASLLLSIHEHRDVPCFVVSPPCEQRSNLLRIYAQIYHPREEIQHLNAGSVDFTSILETGRFQRTICDLQRHAHYTHPLLIIEDLPLLAPEQSARFSDALDAIVEQGWLAIVVLQPENDCYENMQSDRYLIDANMILAAWAGTEKNANCIDLNMFLANKNVTGTELMPYVNAMLEGTDTALDAAATSGLNTALGAAATSGLNTALDAAATSGLKTALDAAAISDKSSAIFFGKLQEGSAGFYYHDSWQTQMQNLSRNVGAVSYRAEVEPLTIRLLGGLEVYRGTTRIEDRAFNSRRIRTLLLYLALGGERGLSRDWVISQFWPVASREAGLDNFAVLWSRLGKALMGKCDTNLSTKHSGICTVANGSVNESQQMPQAALDTKETGKANGRHNPYLSHRGSICKFDDCNVRIDVRLFEKRAKQMLFTADDYLTRIRLAQELEGMYNGGLVVEKEDDSFMRAADERIRAIYVDVMIEASRLFEEQGNQTTALWMARKAYETDTAKEEVYRALMETEIKAGKRTSAMQTYFACKRFLSEELGILPSQLTTNLYQELIMDNA